MRGDPETEMADHLANRRTELVVLVCGHWRRALFVQPGIDLSTLAAGYTGATTIEDGPGRVLWSAEA